ncbi:MAG: DUF3710 domain-containing protein [Candidatus Nanopelagicales bacterium]
MFRRRKGDPLVADPLGADPDGATESIDAAESESSEEADLPAGGDDATGARAAGATYDRAEGPFDVSEVADDDEVPRLDIGGLRVPLYDGMELRLDVDEPSGSVMSVTVVVAGSAVQITAFAAPRVEGIWDDVRKEIAAGVSTAGGTIDEVTGPFGLELHAAVPAEAGARTRGLTPLRFIGVDGPRWFLRALFTDAAARGGPTSGPLEAVVRGCVVVRGSDPMAPGDALTLVVPSDVPHGLERTGGLGEGTPDRTKLPPPRRGPEITEIR